MRGLLKDDNKHKLTSAALRKKFVFLNAYCASGAEEHEPRGPDGPFQFNDRSVPVLVIKKCDGTTFEQQLGWAGGAERLAPVVEKAIKANGPIAAPKALRPLQKSFDKAQAALAKKRVRDAVRELQKVVKAASHAKKFPNGMPSVGERAKAELGRLEVAAVQKLKDLESSHAKGSDETELKKALYRLNQSHGGIPAIKKRIQAWKKRLAERARS
ncbi:MAG: hypothetical protein AB8H80_22645 [Planctomycetota bacterium]